jgi:NitT/TauT family transport system substrate-binding protein
MAFPPSPPTPPFEPRRGVDRRTFVRRGVAGSAAVALPGWLLAACGDSEEPQQAADAGGKAKAVTIKATHGTGLCNLGIFLEKERGLGGDAIDLKFVTTPTNADIATLFGAGQVDASLLPYSNFMTLFDNGAPVKIVAGGGVQGCVVCAQPGIGDARALKGKTLGTFQADTLEVLALDYLRAAGMTFDDVDVKYFGTSPELAAAFIGGKIDAISHIEPYATQVLRAVKGSTKLTDGQDVYFPGYTDCVLAVREPLLKNEPAAVKALITGLMKAQALSEADRPAAAKLTTGTYYKTDYADVLDASEKQPNVVDQRGSTKFILERAQRLKELGYIKKLPDESVFDYSLLEQVIKDEPALYESLKLKYA